MTISPENARRLDALLQANIDAQAAAHPNGGGADLELRFASLREFIAVQEPSANPLLGTADETVIPVGGDVVTYGNGGAGKTTWSQDGVAHLASGMAWCGLEVPRPVTITIIENEGPRGKFRTKLKRKVAAWDGDEFMERVHVFEEPWAQFTFSDPRHREQLAAFLAETKTDLLISGPISTIGMVGGGTPDEINTFVGLLGETRRLLDHPVAWWGIHHENRAGQVSGAWERVPDTLIHITPRGNGHTRVFWQKTRWSSELHQTTMNLAWSDGWSYTLEEAAEPATAERIWDKIAEFVLEHGGCGWNRVDEAVGGKGELKRETRDRMLVDGVIQNAGGSRNMKLWHRDDPVSPFGDAVGDAP